MAGVRHGTVYVDVLPDFTAFDKQMAAAGKRAQDAVNKAQQGAGKGQAQAAQKAAAEQTKAAEKSAAAQAKAAQKGAQAQVTAATQAAQKVAKVQQTEAQKAAVLQQRLQDKLQRDAQVAAQKLAQQKVALEQKTQMALSKSEAMHQQRRVQAQTKAADTAARAEERAGQRTQLTWQNVFKRVAMYSAAWIGVQGAFRFLGGAISEAGRFQDEVSKATQVYGRSSKSIIGWSKNSASAMGLSQVAALEAAGQFGVMAKLLGKSEPEVVNWSKTLTQLAGDMASFDGGPVSEAVTAISAAFRGEQEPIKRYGVLLDDFTLKQRAMAMGLTKTTVGVLPPAVRAQAAYSIILEQTALKQRDYSRTADQYANVQRTFTATLQNASQTIGQTLLPVVTSLLSTVTDLTEGFMGLDDTTRNWILGLAAGVPAILLLFKGVKALIAGIVGLRDAYIAWKATQTGGAIWSALTTGIAGATAAATLLTAALAMLAIGYIYVQNEHKKYKAELEKRISNKSGYREDLSSLKAQRARLNQASQELIAQNAKTDEGVGIGIGNTRYKLFGGQDIRDLQDAEDKFENLDKTYVKMQKSTQELGRHFGITATQAEILAQHFGIDLTEPIENVTFKFAQATGKTDQFATATDQLTASTLKYAEGVANALDPFLKSEQAHIAYQQSLIDTDAAMTTYRETEDKTKQTQLDMQNAVVGLVGAWGTEYDALVAQNASTEELQASQDGMINKLMEMATHVDGPVKQSILNLAAQIRDVPREWKTEMNANNNASTAINDIQNDLSALYDTVGVPDPGIVRRAIAGDSGARAFLFSHESGGVLGAPTYRAGTGGGEVSEWTNVVGEGAAPEYVIPTDKKYRKRAIALMTAASKDIGVAGLASGGILSASVNQGTKESGEKAIKLAQYLFEMVKRTTGKGRQAANWARQQVGKPYVWAATGPNAFDCSGLTQAAWRNGAGVSIPRTSHEQIAAARAMMYADAVNSAGSLFFTTSAGSPSGGHIAISHGDGSLTNARGVATGVTITGPFPGSQGMPVYDSGGMSVGPGVFRAYKDEIHLPLDDEKTIRALTTAMTKAGGKQITVNANTNANPRAIADEIAWATR